MTVHLSFNHRQQHPSLNSASMITALSKLNPFEGGPERSSSGENSSSSSSSSKESEAAASSPRSPPPPPRGVDLDRRDDPRPVRSASDPPRGGRSDPDPRVRPRPESAPAPPPLPPRPRADLALAERSVKRLAEGSRLFPEEAAGEGWFRRRGSDRAPPRRRAEATTLGEREIRADRILGEGGFCRVLLVRLDRPGGAPDRSRGREYALKHLRPSDGSRSAFARGAADLAIEARFLSLLSHPNIVRLHHVSEGTFAQAYNCSDAPDADGADPSHGRAGARGEIALPPLRRYGYFLVLDYLRDTLSRRIQKTYVAEAVGRGMPHPEKMHAGHECCYGERRDDAGPRGGGPRRGADGARQQHQQQQVHWWNRRPWPRNCEEENPAEMAFLRGSLAKRLGILRQVAGALEYLHQIGIIYRDVKPDNIGFYFEPNENHRSKGCDGCDEGIPKLFDFGLVKELKPSLRNSVAISNSLAEGCVAEEDNVTYKLTGRTGSRRYMAPEVAFYKPYNLKADVYSFGILLYETATLLQPFDGYSLHRHEEEALRNGKRPCLMGYAKSCSGGYFPKDLKPLIEECWDGDMRRRPTMSEVVERLDGCLAELGEYCVSCGDSLNSSTSHEEEVSCSSPLHVCKGVARGKRKGLLSKVNFPSAA